MRKLELGISVRGWIRMF